MSRGSKRYYPLFLDLKGKRVVVIGGGEVALRKIESMLDHGAVVTVIAPELVPGIRELARRRALTIQLRKFESGDCDAVALVIAATDDKNVQLRVRQDAAKAGVLVNVVDVPDLCDFIVPALFSRGDISIAVSTNGKSPSLAARLRDRIGSHIGPGYARLAERLGKLRPELRSMDPGEARQLIREIIDGFEASEESAW